MRIDKNPALGKTGKPFLTHFVQRGSQEIRDKVILGGTKEDEFLNALIQMKRQSENSAIKSLVMPVISHPDINPARNETPVVIVHGTKVTGETFTNYQEAALAAGHPAELTTYSTITEGEELQKSAELVSKNINNARIEVAAKHLGDLSKIKKGGPDVIKKYFQIESDLYGEQNEGVDNVVSLIPEVINKMESLMKTDRSELEKTFSGRTKEIEKALAGDIEKTGFGSDSKNQKIACEKTAAEIMDTISPKAVLVGHSMGGFVSYTLTVNPKENAGDGNEFTYDGGNGVSTIITLSSPVKSGVSRPLPRGLTNYTYNLIEKNILDPMEAFPGMQFSMINPFFNAWYSYNKELMKEMYGQTTNMSAAMTNPIIYAMEPGVEQISEGSDFIKEYVEGKKVPEGITALAVYNPEDGISEPENSVLDESQPNAHNLEVTVPITAEDLKDPKHTRPTEAHKKMSMYPYEHGEEFKEELLSNPKYITRILEPSNYDGVRWQCMNNLMEMVDKDPALFKNAEFKPVLKKVKDVAAEKLPFADSPSYIAHKLLEKIK